MSAQILSTSDDATCDWLAQWHCHRATTQVFRWETELCRAHASYDDQKVNAHQLKATLDLNADRLIRLYDDKRPKRTMMQSMSEFNNFYATHLTLLHILHSGGCASTHDTARSVFYKLDRIKRQARQTQDYRVLDEFAPAQIPQCQAIAQTLQSPASEQKMAAATHFVRKLPRQCEPR